MKARSTVRFAVTSGLLLIIAVMCVLFFYTCSIVPHPIEESGEQTTTEKPIETPVFEGPSSEANETPDGVSGSEQGSGSETVSETETGPGTETGTETETGTGTESGTDVKKGTGEEDQEKDTDLEPYDESKSGLAIPGAPDLDWFVLTEPYTRPVDDWSNSYYDDEIDWSEFVFSDEQIELPDGTYYATLFVNDTNYGTMEFEQVDGKPNFPKAELAYSLDGTLAEDYYEEFFANEEELYSLEYLESIAERVTYDSSALVLRLYFNSSQVPVQTVSMSSSAYSLLRQNYDVTGNVEIKPANFSFQTNISAFINAQYTFKEIEKGMLTASVSLSNTFSFWNMTFNLPISMTYMVMTGFSPSIGSWNGYVDFPSHNLRLSVGNVGNSGFSSGSPFGFTLEKNYGYGTGSAMGNQYTQTITLTEDSLVDILVNGSSVFTRTLSLGIYKLTDFAFVQGANSIVVKIHPLSMGEDTSADQTLDFSQNYDTSLMAKGESVWRFGASIRKIKQTMGSGSDYEFAFVMPTLPEYSNFTKKWVAKENVYDLSALSVFWDQTIGLTHSYTQTHSFSFVFERNDKSSDRPGEYSALFGSTISGTLATGIGTTRATVNTVLSSANQSRNSFSVSISQGFINEFLRPLSLSGSYAYSNETHTLSLNTGYSFSIAAMRLGISLSGSYKLGEVSETIDRFTWNGSSSLSTSFGKNGSFSLNISTNQDWRWYATASLSYSFGAVSANASVSSSRFETLMANVGMYYRPSSTSRNSFQLNVSSINLLKLFDENPSVGNPTISGAWSRSGDFFNFSIRHQASSTNFERQSTSISFNTALAFADGQFAITSSINSPFVIITPDKSLKGATISVSNALDMNATKASDKTFGNVLYTNLSMYKANNIVVFASTGSLFTSSGSFLFKATPVARQGFLAKIKLVSSVTVSGVLQHSGPMDTYDSYSSPVYRVELADNGIDVANLEIDQNTYFFTDVDGRFIISDQPAGIYMIDLNIDGEWYACFFEVPEVDKPGYVALYDDFVASNLDRSAAVMQKYNVKAFDDSYAGSIYLDVREFVTEEDYWNLLFSIPEYEDDNFWAEYEAEMAAQEQENYEQITTEAP